MGSFGDTSPLYVVDGMFYDNINFLNNSDIQDMTILKMHPHRPSTVCVPPTVW